MVLQSSMTVSAAWQLLLHQGIRRAAIFFDATLGKAVGSHPVLHELVEEVNSWNDFRRHEAIFIEVSNAPGVLLTATVHRATRGQGAGGVRRTNYNSLEDALRDGLRLAEGMGRKNALAGLWWGGGKGLIAFSPDSNPTKNAEARRQVYQEYGQFISSLKGCYVTAEDAGTTPRDMQEVFSSTRFTTCIDPLVGGSGNPSTRTGHGVVTAMDAALEWNGTPGLEGKFVTLQGTGHVARAAMKFLLEAGARVQACDIDEQSIDVAYRELGHFGDSVRLDLVPIGDDTIFKVKADVFAPCALGAVLNDDTIPVLGAPIICGAANNQLHDDSVHDKMLLECGKVYVPDFLANRMGIVNCANEQYGYVPSDDFILRHFSKTWENSIYKKTLEVLDLAKKDGKSTAAAANAIADKLSLEPHPIWGDRASRIIQGLRESNWANSA
jgi:glutamate dehydrogenase/leucine dehydrogenase